MQTSSIQGRPHVVPVNVDAFPAGIQSISDISVAGNASKGYTITVKGEGSSAAVKVSLGKPKQDGLNVSIELKAVGADQIGASVVSPFEVKAKVAKLPDIFVITIVNAAGVRVDSRIGTLTKPQMQSAPAI